MCSYPQVWGSRIRSQFFISPHLIKVRSNEGLLVSSRRTNFEKVEVSSVRLGAAATNRVFEDGNKATIPVPWEQTEETNQGKSVGYLRTVEGK